MNQGAFHREYLLRLPLPLAQLYSRAYNAKDARGRHDNSFYLFEATVKLAAAPLVAAYLREVRTSPSARVGSLDRLLAALALPSLGQWASILRELARHFGSRQDAAAHPLGHLWGQLSAPRRETTAITALYRRIKNGPDGDPAGDQSCSLLQLIEGLVQYRNAVFGHGAARFETFYENEMGPLLMPAINDVLAEGAFDFIGPRGSRLVYLTELRATGEGAFDLGLRELVGLQGERAAPIGLSAQQAGDAAPNQVAVLWPGSKVPLRLDPLLRYREDDTSAEVLFLNRDRNGRHAEYLSYTTGRTERDQATAPALTALLSLVTGREVSEQQLEQIAGQTRSETASVELLFAAPEAPSHLIGDYEILAELGRGGMGVVYLARQLSLGRLIALKMLPADLAGDDVALARFRREMRSLARCEHPNIVKVLASGVFPDGRLYYAMEYVPGCDLEQVWRELSGLTRGGKAGDLSNSTWNGAVLAAARKNREHSRPAPSVGAGGPGAQDVPALPLPPLPELPVAADDPGGYSRRVALLMRDGASALQAVHDQNIVHRDVKPANFMLTPDGARLVLMDFGLAKGQSLALTASLSGGLLGTLRYAAPEQLAAASLKVGPPADVHGLGATMWELLTRRRLFGDAADEHQLATLVHDQDVPLLRTIDPSFDKDLEAIVARATERRVADRIPTARDLASFLDLYLEGKPLPIRPATGRELILRWIKANPGKAVAAAAAAVLLFCTGLFWRAAQRAEDRRLQEEQRLVGERLQDLSARLGEVRAKLTSNDLGEARRVVTSAIAVAEKPPTPPDRLVRLTSLRDKIDVLADFEKDSSEAWFAAGQERNLDARNACARATTVLPTLEERGWWSDFAAAAEFREPAEADGLRAHAIEEGHRQYLLFSLLLMNRAMIAGEKALKAKKEFTRLLEAGLLKAQAVGFLDQTTEQLRRGRALEEREPRLKSVAIGVMEQMCDAALVMAEQKRRFSDRRPESSPALADLSATDAYFLGMGNFILGNKEFQNDTLYGILRSVEGLNLAAKPLEVADHELRIASARDPHQYWPVYLLGWTLLSAGRLPEAELAFDTCVAVRPDNPRGYELRGIALARRAEVTEHAGLRAQIQARAARDLDHALELAGPDDPSLNWARADFYRLTGKPGLAIETYMRGLELDERVIEAVSRRPVLDLAMELARGMVAKDPRNADGHALIAMLHATTGDRREALDAATRALESDPDHVRALTVRGTWFVGEQRHSDALADFDRALRRAPADTLAALGRARVLALTGDPAKALAAFDVILAAPPRIPWQRRTALVGRARALLALGHKPEAAAAGQEARSIDPADPDVVRLLGDLASPSQPK